MKTPLILTLGIAVLLANSDVSVAADLGIRHFGLRGGVSANPDQIHGGLFLDAGRLVSDLRFQPSFDVGFGNGVRLATANLDALYPLGGESWRPYAGGGLGINFVDVTNGVGEGRGWEIAPVINVLGGIRWGSARRGNRSLERYLLEVRLGFGDTTDLKLSFGLVL